LFAKHSKYLQTNRCFLRVYETSKRYQQEFAVSDCTTANNPGVISNPVNCSNPCFASFICEDGYINTQDSNNVLFWLCQLDGTWNIDVTNLRLPG